LQLGRFKAPEHRASGNHDAHRGEVTSQHSPQQAHRIRLTFTLMTDHTENSHDDLQPTSSIPSVIPEDQEALFRDVLTALEQANISFAVAGGFALRQHTGICRFTKDLDIFLPPQVAASALEVLESNGFDCEVRDPVWLAKAHRDNFFVDLITGMSNGVITVDSSWMERATPAVVFDVYTRVLAPEELLASKLFVIRRERFDGADIAHIVYGTKGQLQWNRILQLAGDHWELLLWQLMLFRYAYPAHSDYVPRAVWDDLLSRLVREVRAPEKTSRFRGSLIDDTMFAIDVQEWGLDDLLSDSRESCPKIKTEKYLMKDGER
jgi:hypothetical protein